MVRKYKGTDLAKVLTYYGLVEDITTEEFKIVCPFHGDVNPSMKIKLSDGTFFCFGCGLSGNAYDFVKLANPQVNDLQNCVLLEQILNSNEVRDLKIKAHRKRKKNDKQALIEAKDYYYGLKSIDWNKAESEEEQHVLEYMKARGFGSKALNIADCRVNYNIAYPFIFPILDNGIFKGWVGRTTNRYVEQKRKYLYNDGFRKRDTICGNYGEKCIPYICEGYMDYLSLRVRGHTKYVCALLGWHISDEQVKKLKEKGVTTVVSALDNDKAGRKGTEYLKRFFNVIEFPYPDGVKDSGEMTEKQLKIARQKVRKAINAGQF